MMTAGPPPIVARDDHDEAKMSKRGFNRPAGWDLFLAEHAQPLAATGLPSDALRSEDRFRRLLGEGSLSTAGKLVATLDALEGLQWANLEGVCLDFFEEFESYDPLGPFLAFKHELRRRGRVGKLLGWLAAAVERD